MPKSYKKLQHGGGTSDSLCPFCHLPLSAPLEYIYDNDDNNDYFTVEEADRIAKIASWMDKNIGILKTKIGNFLATENNLKNGPAGTNVVTTGGGVGIAGGAGLHAANAI